MAKIDIEMLALEYNSILAKEKLIGKKVDCAEFLKKYGYTKKYQVSGRLYSQGYRKIDGRYIKCEKTSVEKQKSTRLQDNKNAKKKKIKCNMPGCNKMFTADLDKKGIPYQRRCPKCRAKLKNNPYYECKGKITKTSGAGTYYNN